MPTWAMSCLPAADDVKARLGVGRYKAWHLEAAMPSCCTRMQQQEKAVAGAAPGAAAASSGDLYVCHAAKG